MLYSSDTIKRDEADVTAFEWSAISSDVRTIPAIVSKSQDPFS